MEQYILKSALIAEIESKRNRAQILGDNAINNSMQQFYDGMKQSCVDILSFLNTLEVKEVENFIWNNARTTVPEDSTNQIICIKEDGLAVSTIGKIANGTVKWAYLDDLLNTNSFNAEVKEVDLDMEVALWANVIPEIRLDDIERLAKYFFELGLKAKEMETWHLQEKEDIYDVVKDWSLYKFACIMKDGTIQKFTGIRDEDCEGHINVHIDGVNDDYDNIDDIVKWIEYT